MLFLFAFFCFCLSFISYSCLPTEYSSYSSNSHSFPIENDSPMDFDIVYCTQSKIESERLKKSKLGITSALIHTGFCYSETKMNVEALLVFAP